MTQEEKNLEELSSDFSGAIGALSERERRSNGKLINRTKKVLKLLAQLTIEHGKKRKPSKLGNRNKEEQWQLQ